MNHLDNLDHVLDDALLKALMDSCAKHEIRGEHEAAILSWARAVTMRHSTLDSLRKGHVDVVSIGADGDPAFRITPAGKLALTAHLKAIGVMQ